MQEDASEQTGQKEGHTGKCGSEARARNEKNRIQSKQEEKKRSTHTKE